MRKLFSFLLAALLIVSIAGVASAVSIPAVENAEDGPAVWLIPVYNNESAEMSIGDCAEWDIGSSTGDNDNYVVECDTADTFLVAGIVYPAAIGAGKVGSIAVKGVVSANFDGQVGGAGELVCASGTEGLTSACSDTATDANAFGFTTADPASNAGLIYIFGR